MLIQIIILLIFIQILILNYLSPAHTIYVYFASIVLWYKTMKDAWILRVSISSPNDPFYFTPLRCLFKLQLPALFQVQNTDLPYSHTSFSALLDLRRVLRLMKVALSKLPCIKYECRIWKIKGLCLKECQGEQNGFRSYSANRHIYKCFC